MKLFLKLISATTFGAALLHPNEFNTAPFNRCTVPYAKTVELPLPLLVNSAGNAKDKEHSSRRVASASCYPQRPQLQQPQQLLQADVLVDSGAGNSMHALFTSSFDSDLDLGDHSRLKGFSNSLSPSALLIGSAAVLRYKGNVPGFVAPLAFLGSFFSVMGAPTNAPRPTPKGAPTNAPRPTPKATPCSPNPYAGDYSPPSGLSCAQTWSDSGQTICGGQCANPDNDPKGPWCVISGSTGFKFCSKNSVPTTRPTQNSGNYPTPVPTPGNYPTPVPTPGNYPTPVPTPATSAGATAGGVIGGLLAVGLAGGLLFFFIRRRKKALSQTQQKMTLQDVELPPQEQHKRNQKQEPEQKKKEEQQRKKELERAAQEQKKQEEQQRNKEAALAAEKSRLENKLRSLEQEMSPAKMLDKEPKRIETLEQQQQKKDEQQRKMELERAAQEKKEEEQRKKEAALAAEQKRLEEMARSLEAQKKRQSSSAEEDDGLFGGKYKRTTSVDRRATVCSSGTSRVSFVEDHTSGKLMAIKISKDNQRLDRENQVLSHLQKLCPNEVVQRIDFHQSDRESGLVLQKGELDLRQWINSNIKKLKPNQKQILAARILEIGAAIADARVVWGDAKPANFVYFFTSPGVLEWKAIDFESSVILARTGKTMWSSEDQISDRYIAPERYIAATNGWPLEADEKQDVFCVGLVLYFVWTGTDFFGPGDDWKDQLTSPEPLKIRLPPNDPYKKNLEEILSGMLEKNPKKRSSFRDIMKRTMISGYQPSAAPMNVSVSSGDRSVLQEVAKSLHQLKEGQQEMKQGQAEMKDYLQDLKKTLSKTFNLIVSEAVNGNGSEVPRFVLMVPLENQHNKPGRIARLGKAWKQTLTNVGLKHFFKMIIVDETQQLLTEHGISPSPDLAADGEPMHEGYDLVLPGETLGKIAPFLHVLSGAITVAGTVAKIAGFSIPAGIKEEVLALKELGEEMENFHEIWEDSGLGSVKDKLDTIKAGIETNQDLAPLRTGTEIVYGPFFEQVERVLYGKTSQADSNSPFLSDIKAGKIVKLKNLSRGTTHFVGRRNFQLYFKSRRDLFAASEFNYKSA